MPKVFTTGQVAKICKVAPRTVSKWFDSGRLKGFQVPGSQDRRIPRDNLITFLKEHGVPFDTLEDDMVIKVIIIADDAPFASQLVSAMPEEQLFKARVSGNTFDAGMLCHAFHPDAVVIDSTVGKRETHSLFEQIKQNSSLTAVTIIKLEQETGTYSSSIRHDIGDRTEIFRKPFDPALLATRLRTVIGTRKELL